MKSFRLLLLLLAVTIAAPSVQAKGYSKACGCDKGKTKCELIFGCEPHVLVVSHRGDWRNYPENSLEAIESCIEMGVDMVEIDVAKTKDGHLILMHDKTIDRTTSKKGLVSDYTLAEIRELKMRNGMGRVTRQFTVPTLEEAMLVAKNKIIVNLDKADKYFDQVYEILKRTKTLDQTIIKSKNSYASLCKRYGDIMDDMIYMPMVKLNESSTFADVEEVLNEKHPIYAIGYTHENKQLLLAIKERLEANGSRIWMNTLWETQSGVRCDDRALKDPDKNWGFLVEEFGANVIQTDRPAMMLKYFEAKGYR